MACCSGKRPLGSACQEKEACSSGYCLQESRWGISTGWKDGYCTETCSGSCKYGVCVAIGNDSLCMAKCGSDSDCRTGYVCNPSNQVCLPDCRSGWDCGDQLVCDSNGYCSVKQVGMGDPCKLNVECTTGYCIPQQSTDSGYAWKDGMCSEECGNCPTGFTCLQLTDSNLCLPQCSAASDCRTGYVCNTTVNICLPDCRLGWDCGNSLTCNNNMGFCE